MQWTRKLISGQALEGKDVKDLLLNVGSGGGAAAAPAAGGAAAGGEAAAEEKAEEKEEGLLCLASYDNYLPPLTSTSNRERRVGRGHGFWPVRLDVRSTYFL